MKVRGILLLQMGTIRKEGNRLNRRIEDTSKNGRDRMGSLFEHVRRNAIRAGDNVGVTEEDVQCYLRSRKGQEVWLQWQGWKKD
jgi:hypothetical protein